MTPLAWVIVRGVLGLILLLYLVVRLIQALIRGTISSPVGQVSRQTEPGGFWVMIGWRVLLIALTVLIMPVIIWGLGFTGGI